MKFLIAAADARMRQILRQIVAHLAGAVYEASDGVEAIAVGRLLRELSIRDLMEVIDQTGDLSTHLPEQLRRPAEVDSMNGRKEKKSRMAKPDE